MSLKNWNGRVWNGVYKTFAEVTVAGGAAFEDSVWKEKVQKRATELLRDTQVFLPIPKSATTTDYALPFIASTLRVQGRPLRVLDFGGGLGTSFVPTRDILSENVKLQWVVVENTSICRMGRELFGHDSQIVFSETLPQGECFDIAHFGSSIHYVDDWLGLIRTIADMNPEYFIFTDLPAGTEKTFITSQHYYGHLIPVRFWNLQEFKREIENFGYELIFQSNYRGYYMDQESVLPTEHFDSDYRLKSFCQLVFRRRESGSRRP